MIRKNRLKEIIFFRRTLMDYEVIGDAPVPASWVYNRQSKVVLILWVLNFLNIFFILKFTRWPAQNENLTHENFN